MSLAKRTRALLALALGVVITIPAFALGLASPANAAYGDTYIGYSKDDGWDATTGAHDNIYVYEGTTAPIPDSNSVVANLVYCFNIHRAHPEATLDDPNASDFETFVRQIGSGDLLDYTDRAASPVYTPLGLDAHVESVLYNGYPNDNAGIQAHYGLTDAEFHAMTQSAIWALTDAYGVSLANDRNGGDMRHDIATARVDGNLFTTDAQKQAYYALLGIAAPVDGTDMTGAPTLAQVPAEVRLDIYESTNAHYQNLLSASFVPTNPTPTPTPVPVKVSKVDLGGNELPGADIEIHDAQGAVVESWTSGSTPQQVTLAEGTYTFHEVVAPTGYKAVTEITFTVDANGQVTVDNANGNTVTVDANGALVVTDQYTPRDVTVSKVDIAGNELPGASIEIKDTTGAVVESWTSTTTPKDIQLVPGTYAFHEVSAPNGYETVTDITFTVDTNGAVTVKDAAGNTVTANGDTLVVTDQPTTPADTTPAPGSQQPGLVGTGVDGVGALGVLIAAVLVAGMGVLLMSRGRRAE